MIIQCPACNSRYMVPSMKVGAGRHVRCKKCLHQWWHNPNANLSPLPKSFMTDADNKPKSEMEQRLSALREAAEKREVVEKREIITEKDSHSNPALTIVMSLCLMIMGFTGAFVFMKDPLLSAFPELKSLFGETAKASEQTPEYWQHLEITNINRKMEEDGSNSMLIFTGEVINNGTQSYILPKVRVSLYDEQGKLLDYWKAQPDKTSINPTESAPWMVYFHNPNMSMISEFKATLSE